MTLIVIFARVLCMLAVIVVAAVLMTKDILYKTHFIALLGNAFLVCLCCILFYMQRSIEPAFIAANVYEFSRFLFFAMMLSFCTIYCVKPLQHKRLGIVFFILTVFDALLFIYNIFNHNVFTLEPSFILDVPFYKMHKSSLYAIHFAFLIFALLYSFVLSLYVFLSSSSLQKRKYRFFVAVISILLFFTVAENFSDFMSIFSCLFSVPVSLFCYLSAVHIPEITVNYIINCIQESLNDAILCFDNSAHLSFANSAAKKIMTVKKMQRSVSPRFIFDFFRQEFSSEQKKCSWVSIIELNSKIYWFDILYETLEVNGEQIGSYFLFKDITIAHDEYEEQKFYADHDSLTGLYNRTKFFAEVNEAVKNNPYTSYVMLYSNIKDFKIVNNIFGKQAGDRVLIKVAELLRKNAHKTTLYARISDDKFAVFMEEEYFSEEFFISKLNDIQLVIENPVYTLMFNFGIYRVKGTSESADLILDKAILAAKRHHNTSGIFSYFDDSLMHRIVQEKYLLSDFDSFIANKKYAVKYKPVVDSERKIHGAKCSADWHDEDNMYSTTFVINTLDKAGLIYRLDKCIWEESIKSLSFFIKKNADFFINLHVCEKDFYYMEIEKTLSEFVERYKVPAKNIHICIPEKIVSKEFERLSGECRVLRNAGFKILIEDFGTDFSSLNMLKNIQVDLIEIDVRYFYEEEKKSRSVAILSSIVQMAKDLDIDIIFSGVDEKDCMDLVSSLDGVLFDGKYFSVPLSSVELEKRMS